MMRWNSIFVVTVVTVHRYGLVVASQRGGPQGLPRLFYGISKPSHCTMPETNKYMQGYWFMSKLAIFSHVGIWPKGGITVGRSSRIDRTVLKDFYTQSLYIT